MTDNSWQPPSEMIEKLQVTWSNNLKNTLEELQRSFDVSSSFYEKLAAIDAASIAIAASVGVGTYKFTPVLSRTTLAGFFLWLILPVSLLWLSLIGAVLHNFILIRHCKIRRVVFGESLYHSAASSNR